jgi:hypothetical protein
MSTPLIHIVGPQCQARLWLVHALMNGLRASGTSGALVDVLDAQTHDNAMLRRNPHLGCLAVVVSDARNPRHDDLAEQDLVISLDISPQALQAAQQVQVLEHEYSTAQCAYVIERARA